MQCSPQRVGVGQATAEPTLGTLRHLVPTCGWNSGEKGGASVTVMVMGTRMQPPCPWYLVPDTASVGEAAGPQR